LSAGRRLLLEMAGLLAFARRPRASPVMRQVTASATPVDFGIRVSLCACLATFPHQVRLHEWRVGVEGSLLQSRPARVPLDATLIVGGGPIRYRALVGPFSSPQS
jgi:hypothetical protein